MTLEQRAAALAADLDADHAAIQSDLEALVAYRVPVEEAVSSLRRKYGQEDADTSDAIRVPVEDISLGYDTVSIRAVVLSAGRRSIYYDGEERVITEGTVADETGEVSYTAWEDFDLARGATVDIEQATVREWDGAPELNFGAQTRIQPSDEPIAVDVDESEVTELADIRAGDRDVRLEVAVVEAERRTIEGRQGEMEIVSGVIGDASAKRPFTDWKARTRLQPGGSVRIENAYIQEYRGIPSVNLSEFSSVATLEEDVPVRPGGDRSTIREAIDAGGRYDVEIRAAVVDVRDGSGLIDRCPECGRVIRNSRCRTHGEVDGVPDLRVKAVIDDGTGAATAILGAELTEAIYGHGVEEAVAEARAAMDQEVIATALEDRLLGRVFSITGQLSVDEYGANIEATAFDPPDEDPAVRARRLLDVVEGEQ